MEKIKESTLLNPPPLSTKRASGNTTRLVDHAIQLLFEGKIVVVHDAWEDGTHKEANRHFFDCIIKRLNYEHHHIVDNIVINRGKSEIYLK